MKGNVVMVVLSVLALVMNMMEALEATVVDVASLNRSSFPVGFVFGTASSAYQCSDASTEGMRREGMKEELSLPPGPITRSRSKKFKESLQIYVRKLFKDMEDQDSIKAQEIIHTQLGVNASNKPNMSLFNYLRPENV
ncbi:cyanogenic beta-glucosidase-like [Senna tora]|uniref:Cyanogenic beta-glucosidase-like n=1 Tax=Senna tora TaxID=362788 RepID=A0A834TMJ4_9FABA|nr:cyanogenic beta-glucosidase-like [Senna tora]